MTQNEIIEMAKEIAVQYGKSERFQTWTHDFMMQRLMKLVAVSAATEREACAKLCDEYGDEYGEFIADVIRSRGQA
jgi:translation initiation factor 2 alpha subunit (eIF-2alpha)